MQRLICFSLCLTVLVSGRIGRAGEEPIWLTDFSTCTPQSALANEPEWKQWQVIEYEADHVSGKMIGGKSHIEVPDVNLTMNIKGWHKIYVGYWNPYFEYDGGMVLRLKLTGDPCFDRIRAEAPQVGEAEQVHPGRTSIMERYWRMADVTDKNLVIGKFKGRKAYIAYIKMVPMQPEEVDHEIKQRTQWKHNRRLVASIDGAGGWRMFHQNIPTEEDIREWVEGYRYSNVGKIVWAFTYGD